MRPDELYDNLFSAQTNVLNKEQIVERLTAYAREMCDKQKDECYLAGMISNLDIKNAPYPKELQAE